MKNCTCTVLIVEDNQVFREVLRDTLCCRFPSIRVLEAEDLAEGGARLTEGAPDVVFLDIGLPDGNGLDLAEVIARERPGTKVVVCTNHDIPEYREAAARRGATHFLAKEKVSWDEVGDLVASTLRATEIGAAAAGAA